MAQHDAHIHTELNWKHAELEVLKPGTWEYLQLSARGASHGSRSFFPAGHRPFGQKVAARGAP
eukprot:8012301-Alexandrium_andersonii.AAC.1